MYEISVLGNELVFVCTAKLAGKICGKVFPLHTGLFLVIGPAAKLTNILHF